MVILVKKAMVLIMMWFDYGDDDTIVMRVMIKLVMRWHRVSWALLHSRPYSTPGSVLRPYSTPGSVLRPSYIFPSPQLSCEVGSMVIPPSLGK